MEGPASDGLVFITRVGSSNEVMRARLSDGALVALTDTPRREESWPYWSGPARRLVFQVAAKSAMNSTDLVLWDVGGGERPLVRTRGRDERWPVWSPRGTRLVYAFRGGRPPSGLISVDVESGTEQLLVEGTRRDFYLRASFAPDGERLVTQRRTAPRGRSQLWIVSPEGPPRPLAHDPGSFDVKAWFTRDGRRIVFSRRPGEGGPHDIVSLRPDGSDLRVIASAPDSDDHSARPSPARDEIVFASDRGGSLGVYLADLSGEGVRVLVDSPDRDEFAPRWSPDGERVVMTTSHVGERSPRLVDPETLGGARLLVVDRNGRVVFETAGLMPDWMPAWP